MVSNNKLLELLNSQKYVELEKVLKANIREENQKKSGRKTSDLTILKNLFKNTKNNPNINELDHICEHNNTIYHCYIDGYRILGTVDDFGYNKADKPFKVNTFLDDIPENEIELNGNELKIYATEHKKTNKPYAVKYNNNYVGLNPQYIIDAINWTKSNKIYIHNKFNNKCYTSPIFLFNEDKTRFAIVLPVKVEEGEKLIEYINNWRNI